jgi:hypothetical protein
MEPILTRMLVRLASRALKAVERGKPLPDDDAQMYAGMAIHLLAQAEPLPKDLARLVLYTGISMPPEFHRYIADVIGGLESWRKDKPGPSPKDEEMEVLAAVFAYCRDNPKRGDRGCGRDDAFIAETAERIGVSERFVRNRLYRG